ncbi:cyclic GMP-AMP synthase-like [Latimeria chalumnae]|uniref:cyclic GMP-AMP synthase-like n=1 Tax=Latimeria chalumnae TaxID=7897 RepID=UPI0006D90E8F|nr:PREDICTED: cyclic GMP-AMP synthase-like [Latimeria chalumnae]|eukprot:XP_014342670.1 PREDICTED: cyclic GMP-AMP synthase-like [Latimeria chalumnae]
MHLNKEDNPSPIKAEAPDCQQLLRPRLETNNTMQNNNEGDSESTQKKKEIKQRIKETIKALTPKRDEKSLASSIINELINQLLFYVKDNPVHPYFKEMKKMTTGSYYEFVKIYHIDEFDVMFLLPVPKVKVTELEEHSGLFYKAAVESIPQTPLKFFLLKDNTISPVKVLGEMRNTVKQFLRKSHAARGWLCTVPFKGWKASLQRKKQGSPAVTLLISNTDGKQQISVDLVPALEVCGQKWPKATYSGLKIDQWLSKKVKKYYRSEPYYLVAKQPQGRELSEECKEAWRISFSHVEKAMMMNHGNAKTCCERGGTPCCRKTCLQLMKALFHILKQQHPQELSKLCSYYAKTAFFHRLTHVHDDAEWAVSSQDECFLHFLDAFIQHLEDKQLPHFFVPKCNLFETGNFSSKNLKFLQTCLKEQRENGLLAFEPEAQNPNPQLPVSTLERSFSVKAIVVPFFFLLLYFLISKWCK